MAAVEFRRSASAVEYNFSHERAPLRLGLFCCQFSHPETLSRGSGEECIRCKEAHLILILYFRVLMNEKRTIEKRTMIGRAWAQLRPKVLAFLVDTGEYLLIWIAILVAHFINLFTAIFGIDPEIIRRVSFMEKWTWIATFANFFLRALVRAGRSWWERVNEH